MTERSYCWAYVPCATPKEAAKIAKIVIREKLAACVNILPSVRSIYLWQNEVCDELETLMICKTSRECFPSLADRIGEHHSYDTPCITKLEVESATQAFADWLSQSTKPPA